MKKTLIFLILLLSFIALSAEQIVVSQYPDDIRLITAIPIIWNWSLLWAVFIANLSR